MLRLSAFKPHLKQTSHPREAKIHSHHHITAYYSATVTLVLARISPDCMSEEEDRLPFAKPATSPTPAADTATDTTDNIIMAPPNSKPTPQTYRILVACLSLFVLLGGYYAATRPAGVGFRLPFSLHPLLMVLGYVGLMGTAHVTKKLGGYSNTKLHGYLASAGLATSFCGLYAIWRNKDNMGKEHLTSYHSWGGIASLVGLVLPALAGLIFLHPDFGIDKTNGDYRLAHKWAGRLFTVGGWISCVVGLNQMVDSRAELVMFAAPLVLLAPFVLI
mmetsp:Transcript_36578/g.74521  ORF Transcript_36578/g.74521 Transcript_36578/m.74521 type:complete len:275 (+) Transcript_36578:105-929(+)